MNPLARKELGQDPSTPSSGNLPAKRTNDSNIEAAHLALSNPSSNTGPLSDDSIKNVTLVAIKQIQEVIGSGDLASIRSLATKDVIMNTGFLLMDFALKTKREDIAQLLMERGASVSSNAALKAIEYGFLFVFEKYINDHGDGYLDPSFLRNAFTKVVHHLCSDPSEGRQRSVSWKIFTLLAEKGDRNPPHHFMAHFAYLDNIQPLRYLLENGYKAGDVVLRNAKTPQHFDLLLDYETPTTGQASETAAANGWDQQLRRLIAMGAPISTRALGLAAGSSHTNTVHLLIENKAKCDGDTVNEGSASGNMSLVKTLLDYGAPLTEKSLISAVVRGNHDMVDFLMLRGAKPCREALRWAVYNNDLSMVRRLIAAFPPTGDSYLMLVPPDCSNELLDCLISASKKFTKADIGDLCDLQPHDRALKYVKILVARGAKVHPSSLNYFALRGNLVVLRYLAELGVSTNSIEIQKVLVEFKHRHIIDYLLSNPNFELTITGNIFNAPLPSDFELQLIEYLRNKVLAKINPLTHPNVTIKSIKDVIQVITTIEHFKKNIEKENSDPDNFLAILFPPKIDLVPLVATLFSSNLHIKISAENRVLCTLPSTPTTWKILHPSFRTPQKLEKLSPWGFIPAVYKEILIITQQAAKKEGDENAELNAYKLTVVFGSKEKALEYLQRTNKTTNRPVHDACLFEIPKCGLWNIETWRALITKHRFSNRIMNLLALAPTIENHINVPLLPYNEVKHIVETNVDAKKRGLTIPDHYRWQLLTHMRSHPSYREALSEIEKQPKGKIRTREVNKLIWKAAGEWLPKDMSYFLKKYPPTSKDAPPPITEFFFAVAKNRNLVSMSINDLLNIIVRQIYGEVEEKYHDFAFECAAAGFTTEELKQSLEIVKNGPKKVSYIPTVKIEGSLLGKPGMTFETMSHTDPMMFVLGKKTSCCQSLNGHSKDCVLHGATQPYGGFVRIMKNGSMDPWVAQSWVGLTEANEFVFDSIEHNRGHDPKTIMEMYALAATAMLLKSPKVKRVLFGGGGNTPKDHGFMRQDNPKARYSHIIGYKDIGYDSQSDRYILAEQGNLNPKYVALLKSSGMDLTPDTQEMTEDGLALISGTDTYVKTGAKIRGLSLNAIERTAFFEEHSDVEAMLRANELNPLLEEGFYADGSKERERVGEYFLTFDVVKDIVEMKIKDNPNYKADHVILVDNDRNELKRRLADIQLADGENILIGLITGVHAVAAYIECINGQLKLQVVDPEPSPGNSPLYNDIASVFPGIEGRSTTERLQVDYYSCSTFLIKSLMFFAKHGHEMLERTDDAAPAPLLKMAQKVDFTKLDQTTMNQIVSFKKGLTLSQYLKEHTRVLEGKAFNAAALRAKYRYIKQLKGKQSPKVDGSP